MSFLGSCAIGSIVGLGALVSSCAIKPIDTSEPVYSQLEYSISEYGHITVDLSVNGADGYTFVVDTAAQSTALYPNALKRLGIDDEPLGYIPVWGAVGRSRVPYYEIKSLEGGGRVMRAFNVSRAISPTDDDLNVDGILGLDFLGRGLLEIDCRTQSVSFHDHLDRGDLKDSSISHTPLRRDRFGFLRFDAEIDGQNIEALLDLGASRNVINWRAANKIGLSRTHPEIVQDRPITGASGQQTKGLHKYPNAEIHIGSRHWHDQALTIADLSVFDVLGLDQEAAAILGVSVFRERRIVIDFREPGLYIFGSTKDRPDCH